MPISTKSVSSVIHSAFSHSFDDLWGTVNENRQEPSSDNSTMHNRDSWNELCLLLVSLLTATVFSVYISSFSHWLDCICNKNITLKLEFDRFLPGAFFVNPAFLPSVASGSGSIQGLPWPSSSYSNWPWPWPPTTFSLPSGDLEPQCWPWSLSDVVDSV